MTKTFILLQEMKYFYLINRLITTNIFLQEIFHLLRFEKRKIIKSSELSRHRRSEINKNLNAF